MLPGSIETEHRVTQPNAREILQHGTPLRFVGGQKVHQHLATGGLRCVRSQTDRADGRLAIRSVGEVGEVGGIDMGEKVTAARNTAEIEEAIAEPAGVGLQLRWAFGEAMGGFGDHGNEHRTSPRVHQEQNAIIASPTVAC